MVQKKKDLLRMVNQHIEQQREELIREMNSVIREIGEETKSSAGDKYETSREMMNQERSRLEDRIDHLNKHLMSIKEIHKAGHSSAVGFGSLVETQSTLFLFGLAYGKLTVENQPVFLLSLNSPIGKAFAGKEVGDNISFASTNYHIQKIS